MINLHECVCVCVEGGGGTLIFFSIRRLGPSIYGLPKEISEISSTPKILEHFATQEIFPFCTYTLGMALKYIEMTPKFIPILL